MIISNIKRINKHNDGFTLVELVIVISGLAALSSFAIPTYLNSVKVNKLDQTKAIINGYAADCLNQYRYVKISEKENFNNNAKPTQLNELELASLGYEIDSGKNKCSELTIKPIQDKEEKLFPFGFVLEEDKRGLVTVRRTAESSKINSNRFLNSCKGWAGDGCQLTAEQKEEFARKAAIAKNKTACLSKYSRWLSDGSSGEFSSWDSEKETCTRPVFAFEGVPVNSAEAVDQALKNKYGKACSNWRVSKRDTISPNGNPETLNPECGGVKYWFHSGNEFTTQAAWNAYDNLLKQQLCISNRSKALQNGTTGEYTYNPEGPPPCGKVVWFCSGKEYETLEAYKSSSCGATPPPPEDPPMPPHCVAFYNDPKKPHPFCKFMRPERRATNPLCVCK